MNLAGNVSGVFMIVMSFLASSLKRKGEDDVEPTPLWGHEASFYLVVVMPFFFSVLASLVFSSLSCLHLDRPQRVAIVVEATSAPPLKARHAQLLSEVPQCAHDGVRWAWCAVLCAAFRAKHRAIIYRHWADSESKRVVSNVIVSTYIQTLLPVTQLIYTYQCQSHPECLHIFTSVYLYS